MNIDINSRIKWQPGMVLTAETFGTMDANLSQRQRLALRTRCRQSFGLLPETSFSAQGLFVQGNYEIGRLECTALLPAGDILSIDEPVTAPFVHKGGDFCYLCVGFSREFIEYEHDNVPHIRPKYEYDFRSLNEIERDPGVMPLARFSINGGKVQVDDQYIVPSLTCDSPLIADAVARMADALNQVCEHKSLKAGDAHQILLWHLFRLRSFSTSDAVEHLVRQTEELMQAIYYFIASPDARTSRQTCPTETEKMQRLLENPKAKATEALKHPNISYADIGLWITWCENYIAEAIKVLDGEDVVDDSIDLAALKQEIKDELYQQLYEQLRTELTADLTESLCHRLRTELDAHIAEILRQYTDGTVRQQLHDSLHTELRPDLYDTLYRSLYEALYEALQTPEPVEEHFYTPLI